MHVGQHAGSFTLYPVGMAWHCEVHGAVTWCVGRARVALSLARWLEATAPR